MSTAQHNISTVFSECYISVIIFFNIVIVRLIFVKFSKGFLSEIIK